MGCGGSRADAIEPRYYESWTRETESTWLTNTDSESPPEPGGADPGSRELGAGRAGILEDGKSTQMGGTTTPATTGILSTEKRTISGAQCVNTAGAGPPRQSSFRAAEACRNLGFAAEGIAQCNWQRCRNMYILPKHAQRGKWKEENT
ncbi:brain and acute leukemia cytoplasmic protein isoform X1 [Tympanuchus pallidicinctus]|uniref:brain and acute leukemia cytoplasmic protein isoform X1 n=1 Tax=Tympanuchus pallidicinctus TaxID=109042 RepID=UPI0022871E9C|nr:brain and acute leukemia cytoplasmic protein isoform X1 [Tympanuchus pallidicinctus]